MKVDFKRSDTVLFIQMRSTAVTRSSYRHSRVNLQLILAGKRKLIQPLAPQCVSRDTSEEQATSKPAKITSMLRQMRSKPCLGFGRLSFNNRDIYNIYILSRWKDNLMQKIKTCAGVAWCAVCRSESQSRHAPTTPQQQATTTTNNSSCHRAKKMQTHTHTHGLSFSSANLHGIFAEQFTKKCSSCNVIASSKSLPSSRASSNAALRTSRALVVCERTNDARPRSQAAAQTRSRCDEDTVEIYNSQATRDEKI